MSIRLLLVDDHVVVRMGMRMLFDSVPDFEIVGEADNALDAITAVSELHPDVVLMDIGLPDLSGIEATRRIKADSPKTAVVALTIHEDKEYFFKMLDAGANGYVPKRAAPEELITAIRAAATDDVYIYPSLATFLVKDYLQQQKQQQARSTRNDDGLTPREQEVLLHLADGETNAEIGEKLTISPRTVARHRENIMQKLNLHSRTELVKYAIRKGIIRV